MPKMTYNLGLITDQSPSASRVRSYLDKIGQSYEELPVTHVGLRYLARHMKQEGKSPPALIYRNQIVSITTRFKVHQALLDWGLLALLKREE